MMKPTYQEYRNMVKASFSKLVPDMSDKQIEAYMNEDDSVDVIEDQYRTSEMWFDKGEITETMFRNGSVSAAAHCLFMLC